MARWALALVAVAFISAASATAAQKITGEDVTDSSLSGRDIRDSSVTGADVLNRSLSARDFATSIRGPAGPPGVNAADRFTQIEGPPVDLPAQGAAFAQAYCPAGEVALSGGHGLSGNNAVLLDPVTSSQISDGAGRYGWGVLLANLSNEAGKAQAFAYCAPSSRAGRRSRAGFRAELRANRRRGKALAARLSARRQVPSAR